jgi:hypothetical protein
MIDLRNAPEKGEIKPVHGDASIANPAAFWFSARHFGYSLIQGAPALPPSHDP